MCNALCPNLNETSFSKKDDFYCDVFAGSHECFCCSCTLPKCDFNNSTGLTKSLKILPLYNAEVEE